MKRKNTFATPQNPFDEWFDLFEDWSAIEASFAADYHIRLRNEKDMSWGEFVSLLQGLSSESPLGRLISVRRENDKNMLKGFSPEQKAVRNEWRSRQRKKASNNDFAVMQIDQFEMFCKQAFHNADLGK